MELKQFVRETIGSVIQGINEAKQDLAVAGIGAAIAPVWDHESNFSSQQIRELEFDVAVTAATTSASESGAGVHVGIQVLGAKIGGEDRKSTEQSSVSRVKFSVPFIPPSTVVKR